MKNINLSFEEYIDSVHIKIYQTKAIEIIEEFIQENNLKKYYNKNQHNDYKKAIVKLNNTILFSYYYQTFKDYFIEDFIIIEAHGLKRYSIEDKIKSKYYTLLLQKLTKAKEQYHLQRLDYSIDIDKEANNIFLYKEAKGSNYNSLANFDFKSTTNGNYRLEVDNENYNSNRKDRATIYDKQLKEDLEETKTRIEISLLPQTFRELRKLDDSQNFLTYLKKEIDKYKIYYFKDIELLNSCIKFYKNKNYSINSRTLKKLNKKYLSYSDKIDLDFNNLETFFCNF
jgi:hypothetical protein